MTKERVESRQIGAVGLVLLALTLLASATRAEDAAKPELYDLVLISCGDPARAAKAVHDISGMNLKEAKVLAEVAPKTILSSVTKAMAEQGKKHAEAAGCRMEIRPAQPDAAAGTLRRFDVAILKVDPSKRESVAKWLADSAKAAGAIDDKALLSNLTLGEADITIAALEAAGATVELVSTGGVETGAYSVMLTRIEPRSKFAVISAVREHTGLTLASATKLIESLPHVVKIKIAKDEAEKIKAALEAHKAAAEIRECGK